MVTGDPDHLYYGQGRSVIKKVLMLSFAMFYIFTFFTGCDSVDNKNKNDDETLLTTTPELETTVTTTQETMVPEPAALPNIDMAALIKTNIDVLSKDDPNAILYETGSLDNELFNEIVALDEDALPYLKMITDRSYGDISWYPNLEFEHRIWAVHALYAIKPETYDLSFPSSDGEYTAKVIVDSFRSFYNYGQSFNEIHIIENATNEVIYTTDMGEAFSLGGLFSPKVNWPADSRFAVIDCSGRRSGSVMAIDLQSKSNIFLPGVDEAINHVFPGKDVDALLLVPRVWFEFESWVTEEIVKIGFYVSVIADDGDFSGWYTYDLTKKKIFEIEHSFNKAVTP